MTRQPIVTVPGPAGPHQLRPGDVVAVGKAASVQFWHRPIRLRVCRIRDCVMDGWVYLDGYELADDGQAVEAREILVQPAGLRLLQTRTAPAAHRRPTNTRIPQQRAAARTRAVRR